MTLIMLLQWWNLVYIVPFGLALMYLGVFVFTGITFGDADVDGELDAGGEVDGDADGTVHVEAHVIDTEGDAGAEADGHGGFEHNADADDSDGAATAALTHMHGHGGDRGEDRGSMVNDLLSFLGLGKIPVSLGLMILLLLWGVIGFGLNAVVARWIGASGVVGFITLPITLVLSVLLTGGCAAVIAKIIPAADSRGQRREDLVGRMGDAIYDIDSSFGMASVRTATGDLMQVPCQTAAGETRIPKGSRVVLFHYDREKGVFHVAPFAM